MAREYIDIWELLPETWQVESAEGACCHSKRPRRSLVTDINVWVECYATLEAILSCTYPEKAPHFFCLPPHNHQGEPDVQEFGMGYLRYGVQ